MVRGLVALGAGTLFGAGLAISGMTDPARVRAFLDLLGRWDPTLAFVMVGAMIPMAIAWIAQRRMARPLSGGGFSIPDTHVIDRSLMVGALIFGIGWGLAGLCPGPAIANLTLAPLAVLPFLLAMALGILLYRVWSNR